MKKSLSKLRRKIVAILSKDSNCAWQLYQKLVKTMDDMGCIHSDHQNALATKIMQDVFQYDVTGLRSYFNVVEILQSISPTKTTTDDQDEQCLPNSFEPGFSYMRNDNATRGPAFIYVIKVDNDNGIISCISSNHLLNNPHNPGWFNAADIRFEDYQKLPLGVQSESTSTPTAIQFKPGALYIRRDDVLLGPLFVFVKRIDNDRNIIDVGIGQVPTTLNTTTITLVNGVDIEFVNYRKATMDDIIKYQLSIDSSDTNTVSLDNVIFFKESDRVLRSQPSIDEVIRRLSTQQVAPYLEKLTIQTKLSSFGISADYLLSLKERGLIQSAKCIHSDIYELVIRDRHN